MIIHLSLFEQPCLIGWVDNIRCINIPRLTYASGNSLRLFTFVFVASISSTLFKIPFIGITMEILFIKLSTSPHCCVSLSISSPMSLWEQSARFVTNLESIAVEIVITTFLAEFNSHPIILKRSFHWIIVINTFTYLLSIVVDKFAKDTMICWQYIQATASNIYCVSRCIRFCTTST
jgi:hypothetical protein